MTLSLVRCSVPSQISHGRILHVLDTEEREVDMKGLPGGLCSCKRMLQWELARHMMQAIISKGTGK